MTTEAPRTRLFLLGDADVLDALSELIAHLRYDEIHRADELPDGSLPLGPHDQVVVAARDAKRAREVLAQVLGGTSPNPKDTPKDTGPGYLALCAAEKDALVALLKLSADRVPKDRLDRIALPAGTGAPCTDGELAILVAADLVKATRAARAPG